MTPTESVASPTNERTMGLPSTFAMWLGANVVVTTILTGMFLVPSLSLPTAMTLVLLGSAVGILPLIAIGVMGQKTGLTTMTLSKATYGNQGGKLPAIINVLSLIAWSWIQARLAGMSLDYAVNALTGFSNVALFTVICEVIVVLIAIRGHVFIETSEKIIAAVMVLFIGVVLYTLLQKFELSQALSVTQSGDMTKGVALDIVIATAFSWIPLAADYNRHCKTIGAAITGTWAGYVLATCLAMGLGATVALLSLSIGREPTYDPTVLLAEFGFGLPAALVILMSVVTTNVMCVYSASLSFMTVKSNLSFKWTALTIGIITVIGSLIPGILEQFQTFLLIIGSMFIPAFALMIVDYFLLKTDHKYALLLEGRFMQNWNVIAFVSYAIGAALAYYFNWVSPLDFGASLPVFVITGVIYFIGMKLFAKNTNASTSV